MTASGAVYLAGMLAMFVAARILDGADTVQTVLVIVALAQLAAAAAMRFNSLRAAKDDGTRLGHRVALMCLLVGCASLVMYAATTETVVTKLTLAEEAEERWLGVWRSLWPVVWVLGTIPLIVVDYAIWSSPVVMPRRRVTAFGLHGLVVAMGLALVFPVNYIASQEKERWDLAYFKTPTAGTATVALAQGMDAPVDVRIFMPPSSEVAQELIQYFEPLKGPNLTVEVIDQAAQPKLANVLAVRDNGVIAFTSGEVDLDPAPPPAEGEEEPEDDKPKPVTRTLRVNVEFDKAKRTLKKIDTEVQKLLIEVGHGERKAYVTSGHGERTWKSAKVTDQQIKGFRDRLKNLGFTVKELGIQQGLAKEIPDDADFVAVLGASHPFQPLEVQALQAYLEGGGSLLIAIEPEVLRRPLPEGFVDPLEEMVRDVLGLKVGEGVLTDERNHLALKNNAQDRFLIHTDSYSQHGSSTTVASRRPPLVAPMATYLEETESHDSSVTVTVRTRATTWADLDGNATFEADKGESKTSRALVAAVTGGSGDVAWRAIVTGDASIFSDVGLGNSQLAGFAGNVLLTEDSVNWLIGAEAFAGTTESEEDVRIDHTKGTQKWWFYGTVGGLPFIVFLLGVVRIQLRTRGRVRKSGGKS